MKTIGFIFLFIILTSCGKKTSHSKKINQVFVKGDPLAMTEGTLKDDQSFLTTENVNEFQGFASTGIFIFTEKELITKQESEDIESGNEAEDSDLSSESATIYNLNKLSTNKYTFEAKNGEISYNFENINNQLQLTSIKIGKTIIGVTVEHYSVSEDKSKLSFLMRTNTSEDGNVLITAAFYRYSDERNIRKTSSDYHYINGPGVVVPWKLDEARTIKVDVCPSMTEQYAFSQIEQALEVWEEPFNSTSQKLDIDVREVNICKPFSDVNSHSIHFIDSYLTIQNEDQANYGFTMPQSDLSLGNIFDADIVILGAEIAKHENYDSYDLDRTLTHEFGHFLGLDHQFDGTLSVMSYESIYVLTEYDSNAITELYRD